MPLPNDFIKVQDFRKIHDRQFRRWPPHINILYPFVAKKYYKEALPLIKKALIGIKPFEITFKEIRYFEHKSKRCTLYLAPNPKEKMKELYSRLLKVFPFCNHQSSFKGGFTPHLSIGQAQNKIEAEKLLEEAKNELCPISFFVKSVYILSRNDPPDDIFRKEFEIQF